MEQVIIRQYNPDPVMMWFHAGECTYSSQSPKILAHMNTKNVHFFAVGEFPRRAFLRRRPDLSATLLPYGINDSVMPNEMRRQKTAGDEVVFAIVGSVTKLKGHDIFLKAIGLLPQSTHDKAIFQIIGKPGTDRKYNEMLLSQICELKSNGVRIEYLGEMSRERMATIYGGIDVVVSASREDAMPIVCTEGAMHCCAIVCSDKVGLSAFIENGESGFVFENEDEDELSNIMLKIIDNPSSAVRMGKGARKIYENVFDTNIFDENVKKIMSNMACGVIES